MSWLTKAWGCFTPRHILGGAPSVARKLSPAQADSWIKFSASLGRTKLKIAETSIIFLRNAVLQFENVAVQKVKRTHSISSLYGRIYQRERLFELLRLMAKRFRAQSKRIVMGGALLSNCDYNYKKEKMSASDLTTHNGEIDECNKLIKRTITCTNCGLRLRIDKELPSVSYCRCPTHKAVYGAETEGVPWKPFLERKDIIVWRMENPEHKGQGMYIYKMYGTFDDVSAEEFVSVQLDMSEFRRSWDTSTAQCHIIDQNDQGAVVYHWEVNWPRFFSNRDYCCYRQHHLDPSSGITVMVARSTEHPNCPVSSKTWRVQDYWSVMTVKPYSTPDKTGIEFSLTAYENPGVRLPEAIITWVAIRGMPEFMENLRASCIKIRKDEQTRKAVKVINFSASSSPSSCSKQAHAQEQSIYGQTQPQPAYA